MGDGESGTPRYRAFISYSHKDAAIGRWLHRRLEGYRLPRRLVGSEGERGPVPARLTPIFRDREELPAAGDLSERVRSALALSESLIVVCSPDAAASPWVAKEIATFRTLHPDRPILAAIVEGEPAQCFPPPLTDEGRAEPLAADLRPGRDGRRLGVLKLVAGLSGVGLDALVQRDAQRRVRRVTYVTAAALAAVLAMAVLTAWALNERREAERQRAQAEGMVEFMLTDLREKLKGVGRIEVLSIANKRALDYYAAQGDLGRLPDDSLERRARVLHAIGNDDEQAGDRKSASARFNEAWSATAATLARHPRDPEAIYTHAQSEYWVGEIAYRVQDWPTARAHWSDYRTLALRLIDARPSEPRSLRELGYAEGNLCTLALATKADPRRTLPRCLASLAAMEKVRAMLPRDPSLVEDIANRHGWTSDVWLALGDTQRAEAHKRAYLNLLEGLAARSPGDMDLQDQLMRALMTTAEFLRDRGRLAESRPYAARARALADRLTNLDPTNARWKKWQARIAQIASVDQNERRGK